MSILCWVRTDNVGRDTDNFDQFYVDFGRKYLSKKSKNVFTEICNFEEQMQINNINTNIKLQSKVMKYTNIGSFAISYLAS